LIEKVKEVRSEYDELVEKRYDLEEEIVKHHTSYQDLLQEMIEIQNQIKTGTSKGKYKPLQLKKLDQFMIESKKENMKNQIRVKKLIQSTMD
jgi:hypothetical protein